MDVICCAECTSVVSLREQCNMDDRCTLLADPHHSSPLERSSMKQAKLLTNTCAPMLAGQLLGNTAAAYGGDGTHNCHFTLSATMTATYSAGMVLSASGNDDVWIFINGQVRRFCHGSKHIMPHRKLQLISPCWRPHVGSKTAVETHHSWVLCGVRTHASWRSCPAVRDVRNQSYLKRHVMC